MSNKTKRRFDPRKSLVKSALYAVKATQPNKSKTSVGIAEAQTSREALEKGRKMARIEAYAKQHNVTITQAMIHFMD